MDRVEKKKWFVGKVVEIRKRVVESMNGEVKEELVREVGKELEERKQDVEEYIKWIAECTQKWNKNEQLEENWLIFQKNAEGKLQVQKVMLFLWQIINFQCINSPQLSEQLLSLISSILQANIQYQYCNSPNSIKNGLIAIHNLIAKAIKTQQIYAKYQQQILHWTSAIILYHFQRTKSHHLPLSSRFNFQKPQETLVAQTEWLSYIFSQLFSNKHYQNNHTSLISAIQSTSKHPKIGFYTLHMIGNFFQEMIDKRVTTQLVSGFECEINDVKQMYDSKSKCLVELKINSHDLIWICKVFHQNMHQYIQIVRKYLSYKTKLDQSVNIESVLSEWQGVTQYIQEIAHALNCVVFIGGYNSKLQDFIISDLLQQNQLMLEYFQLSYLLYRNIQSTRYQSKVNLLIEMEMEAKRKLFSLLHLDIDLTSLDLKSLQLERILAHGQMVSLLRFLTNLVHINHRAQVPFQTSPKYLHMILSLTHDSVSQITMKQWAIMFIRNVSEWSPILRSEISSIKVEMKVT